MELALYQINQLKWAFSRYRTNQKDGRNAGHFNFPKFHSFSAFGINDATALVPFKDERLQHWNYGDFFTHFIDLEGQFRSLDWTSKILPAAAEVKDRDAPYRGGARKQEENFFDIARIAVHTGNSAAPPPLKLDTLRRLIDQEAASHIALEAGIDDSAELP
ncbi:hypothetical protein V8E54_003908 [Elaphomyces granulatus]